MEQLDAIESRLYPGVRIGGYEIDRLLASGGMAKVFVAVQQALGRRVTLKVLNEDLAYDPRFIERFRREARIMSELAHPNIVTIYEFFENQGLHFLAMEHVDGFDLDALLSQVLRLGPEATLLILVDVSRGLREAHLHGLIHRDIKTANLLLSRSGIVKVTDFGIAYGNARREPGVTRLTSPGLLVGTPECMAPEQMDGAPPTPAMDMYGLGVVVFELLTGEVPFRGGTLREIREAMHQEVDLRLELTSGREVAALNELVRSMLRPEPRERLASMVDLELRVQDLLRSFDPSGFLFENRRTILEHLAADPASVCADLSGARGIGTSRGKRYRELFADRRVTPGRGRVASAVSEVSDMVGERPLPKTTRPAAASPVVSPGPRPWVSVAVATLLSLLTLGIESTEFPPRAIEKKGGDGVLPLARDPDALAPTTLPRPESETLRSPERTVPLAAKRVPPQKADLAPVPVTARGRLACDEGAEVLLDGTLVARGATEVDFALTPDVDHVLEIRYPSRLATDVIPLRASADQIVRVESRAPPTTKLTLACSPPGPATVRFTGHDSVLATPAQLEIGVGTHEIDAHREGSILVRAVVTRYRNSQAPVTPEVVPAADGRVSFDALEGLDQRVILKFDPAPGLATLDRSEPLEETKR